MLDFSIMKGYLDLNWHTSEEILVFLKANGIKKTDSELRQDINEFNNDYRESDLFIAHSRRGFLMTTDKDLIEKSCRDKEKRAYAMLKQVSMIRKAKSLKTNIKLDIEQENKIDGYAIVSRMININGKSIEVKEAIYG